MQIARTMRNGGRLPIRILNPCPSRTGAGTEYFPTCTCQPDRLQTVQFLGKYPTQCEVQFGHHKGSWCTLRNVIEGAIGGLFAGRRQGFFDMAALAPSFSEVPADFIWAVSTCRKIWPRMLRRGDSVLTVKLMHVIEAATKTAFGHHRFQDKEKLASDVYAMLEACHRLGDRVPPQRMGRHFLIT
jgi:hypothetical protein